MSGNVMELEERRSRSSSPSPSASFSAKLDTEKTYGESHPELNNRGPLLSNVPRFNRAAVIRASTVTEFDDPNLDSDEDYLGKSLSVVVGWLLSQSPSPSQGLPLPFTDHLAASCVSQPHVEDDSPYPEVRSAVSNTDDPDMPVATIRAWVIGLVWAIIIPGLNQFFYLRYPSIQISSVSQT